MASVLFGRRGGVLMLMGNQNAQRVLFGAVCGAALVFLGPQILA